MTDLRRVRSLIEIAKSSGIKRLELDSDGGISFEFSAEQPEATASEWLSPERREEQRKAFTEKITYLSAGG